MFELKGKVALITGARQGMGKAHALALARQGAKVVVSDIDESGCQKVVEEIKSQGNELDEIDELRWAKIDEVQNTLTHLSVVDVVRKLAVWLAQ